MDDNHKPPKVPSQWARPQYTSPTQNDIWVNPTWRDRPGFKRLDESEAQRVFDRALKWLRSSTYNLNP